MLSDQEKIDLGQFCKIVDDIFACRFYRELKDKNLSLHFDFETPSNTRLPKFDRDDFRSFATLFRKLIAGGETTTLARTMNVLSRFAPDDKKGRHREVMKELRREANRPPIVLSIGPLGSETTYTPQKICDVFFNGMIFHSDPSKQDDLGRILDFEPITMVSFLRYACLVIKVSRRCVNTIRTRDLLRLESAQPQTAND